MEKKTRRRSNTQSLAAFPSLSQPGRLPGRCKFIPTSVEKTRTQCPVCRGLTPSRMPGYYAVLFDWSGPINVVFFPKMIGTEGKEHSSNKPCRQQGPPGRASQVPCLLGFWTIRHSPFGFTVNIEP